MRCAIWYHLYNLKNVKNTHGGVLILVKFKINTPPWVFFTIFKLHKWYQILQRITYQPETNWIFHSLLLANFFSQEKITNDIISLIKLSSNIIYPNDSYSSAKLTYKNISSLDSRKASFKLDFSVFL